MNDLKEKLKALLGDETKADEVIAKATADGLTDEASAAHATVDDWIGYGVPKIKARQLVSELAKAAAAAAVTAAPATSSVATSLLPTVPEDDDFLAMLRTGGVAKMDVPEVMSAVRAVFASRLNLYDIEDRILAEIERRAVENEAPNPEIFYEIEKASGRKAHADVLKALGVAGSFVTERRKKEFLGRMDGLWSVLAGFQTRLSDWQTSWQSKMSNPGALLTGIASMMAGGGAAAAATGLMDAPDTSGIVDASSGVVDTLNKVFAGAGIPVARALAADAVQIRQFLKKPELISAVGATSYEEMLKRLGIGVTSDVVRTEKSLTRYVLGIMKLADVETSQLPMYIVALCEVGREIPWANLANGDYASNGKSAGRSLPDTERRRSTY